jgi:hypothetical protein
VQLLTLLWLSSGWKVPVEQLLKRALAGGQKAPEGQLAHTAAPNWSL